MVTTWNRNLPPENQVQARYDNGNSSNCFEDSYSKTVKSTISSSARESHDL